MFARLRIPSGLFGVRRTPFFCDGSHKMSLSNLSSQLAALNSASAVAVAASSRKHEDSVGRGLYHSAKHGHAIGGHPHSVRFKPSVIHTDAKAAAKADIPLVQLRDNAIASLEFIHLTTQSPLFAMTSVWVDLVGMQSIKYERGLKTQEENKELGLKLHQGFLLLSSVLGEEIIYLTQTSSSSHVTTNTLELNLSSAVLHVLEYLVQLYLPHVYHAESLMDAFLPFHETFLFQRIIQLIDLAALPHWAFLRPYTTGSTVIPRSLIAQWAASTKDNGSGNGILLRQISNVAQTVAQMHASEIQQSSSSSSSSKTKLEDIINNRTHVRPGISFILSFVAALLVEALAIQAKELGTLDEMTVRILLPLVLDALGPSKDPSRKKRKKHTHMSLGSMCADWRGFGYILAVALNEYCQLESSVMEVITTTAVYGVLECSLEETSSSEQQEMDALVALLVFLIRMLTYFPSKPNPELSIQVSHYLPRFSMMDRQGMEADVGGYMGCFFPRSTFQAIIELQHLSTGLGLLFSQKEIRVKSFLASLVGHCISSPCVDGIMGEKDKNSKLSLLLSLIREKPLEPVWIEKDESLSAAVSAFSVIHFSSTDLDHVDINEHLSSIKLILSDLQKMDPIGFDLGISYTLLPNSIIKFKLDEKRLQLLLQIFGVNSQMRDKPTSTKKNSVRPMNLALEYPDSIQRLEAIDRLLPSKPEVSDTPNNLQGKGIEDSIAFVLDGLLRCFEGDDQLIVVAKAAEKILELLNDSSYLNFVVTNEKSLDRIFKGLYKISFFVHEYRMFSSRNLNPISNEIKVTNTAVDALRFSLEMAATVVRGHLTRIQEDNLNPVDDYTVTLHPLVNAIVKIIFIHLLLRRTELMNDDVASIECIHDTASAALLTVLGYSSNKEECATAFHKFTTSHLFDKLLVHSLLDQSAFDYFVNVEREFISTLVRYCSTRHLSTLESRNLLELSIGAVVQVLDTYEDDDAPFHAMLADVSHYVRYLSSCIKGLITLGKISIFIETIAKLSTLKHDRMYELVSSVVFGEIYKVMNISSNYDSFVVLALEIVSRPRMTTVSVVRLLTLLKNNITSSLRKCTDDRMTTLVLTYIMSMMVNCDHTIRQSLCDILVQVKIAIHLQRDHDPTIASVYDLASSPSMRTNFLMDGASTVMNLLRSAMNAADNVHHLRDLIIRGCHLAISSFYDCSLSSEFTLNDGACYASSTIIRTLHQMGEAYFPLSNVWTDAGRPILLNFLQINATKPLPSHSAILLDNVIVLLKGITVRNDCEQIVITTTPTGFSHRSRSYSVSSSAEGICLIDPYPSDMTEAICECLNTLKPVNLEICERICRIVLSSVSWSTLIFPKLDKSRKDEICLQLLRMKVRYGMEIAGSVLMSFPLNCSNLSDLLRSVDLNNSPTLEGLVSVAFVADCIHVKSSTICTEQQIHSLIASLFECLSRMSDHFVESQALDGLDYTRSSILQALLSILQCKSNQLRSLKDSTSYAAVSEISQYIALLTSLITADPHRETNKIITGRGKALAMKLLAFICSTDPHLILSTLLPAFVCGLKELNPHFGSSTSITYQSDILSVIIPAFNQNAAFFGLTFFDLIRTVLRNCMNEDTVYWNIVLCLFQGIYDYLLIDDEVKSGECLASMIASLYSIGIFYGDKGISRDVEVLIWVNDIMNRSDVECRLVAFMNIIRYARDIVSYRKDSAKSLGDSSRSVISVELYLLAWKGPTTEPPKESEIEMNSPIAKKLLESFVEAVRENLLSMNWRSLIKSNDDGFEADLSLKLWREIVTLQSHCSRHKRLSSVVDSLSVCLNTVQQHLPIPHFLASVISIAHDDGAGEDLRKTVIQMLAERCNEVDPNSSEATLFVETIADLGDLLGHESLNNNRIEMDTVLKQAVLACIEQIARKFEYCPNLDERVLNRRLDTLTKSLCQVSILLNSVSLETESKTNVQVLSSLALCASTLISVVKSRCLTFLPQLIKPLIASLTLANKEAPSGMTESVRNLSFESIQLLQISIIRAVQSIGENVPQSLVGFLDNLLAPNCLSSAALRHYSVESNFLVQEALTNLENTLAKHIAPRQLIPSLSKAISFCLKSPQGFLREALVNLHFLTIVVSSSSQSELKPVSGKIVHVLVEAYENDDDEDTRYKILSKANDAMVALIMKLSEAQLRPLYAKLREWKGDLENNLERKACLRRQAFWRLTSQLSIELRGIFLPYMSSVMNDAVNELDNAVSYLCSSPKLSREKRRKVSSAENDPLFSFFSVQPILLALEYSLKADAQDRNNWIVADEGRMYHMLLKPLSKLLLANIPDFFPVQSNLSQQDATISTRYRELVCGSGTEGYGSVIGCLTALALAGGNEVLWKPLNHAILEACSNEDRSEVRKAGIRSLLSIIQALGEEYMVLLPECLPVLSELLEDQDNEIVEMTRRCIQIGEELLGESLF